MSCLVWNCRGLGGSRTVQTLVELIRANNPYLIFLSETKLIARKFEVLRMNLGLNGVAVDARGKSGGLALLWKKDVTVALQSFSTNHIDVNILGDDSQLDWRFTGFYGDPDDTERYKSWILLRHLSNLSSLPWLCAGDFNAMLSPSEKSGGQALSASEISTFGDCLREAGLSDLGFFGCPFTWENRRDPPHFIEERIDRACGTDEWRNLFPNYRVTHLDALNSDHLPIRIELTYRGQTRSRRRQNNFKFEAMWLKSEDCMRVIEESWDQNSMEMNDEVGWDKLNRCRVGLLNWSRSSFGEVNKTIKKLQEQIFRLKKQTRTSVSNDKIKRLTIELNDLLDKEEMLWRQRAKAHWIREGDKNTKYFHAKASARRKTNTITGLRNSSGEWCEDTAAMEGVVSDYFREIFTSNNPSSESLAEVLETIEPRISQEINGFLTKSYTAEEVKIALGNMQPLKSPGPDGFPALFYQKFWRLIGRDVTNWVLRLLNHGEFPAVCNFTHIVLIPKCSNPENMTQFRPISLSNVAYKIASKCIVNRLKPFMNMIISESQSAFVPTRLISDNILIAFEVTHYMKRSSAEHMAIKLDMSKAYDRIEWVFLREVMLRMGLDVRVVEQIMQCVSTVTYSFVLNGFSFGFLVPERGLRQGDPLSPYLFLFCAEALSALFRREESRGNIAGLSVCTGAPPVSHLMFADDTMIFCNANGHSAQCIKNILQSYEKASGQMVNFQKSSIVFSKTTTADSIEAVKSFLPMEVVDKHEKYLGLPSAIGRSKREVFSNIRDNVCHRLQGWKEKWLSKGGKEILIKAVIQAIPSYAMGCFKFPSYFTNELEGLMSKFWWENTSGRGIHWAKWKDLCVSKQFGGLGFRDLESFNTAMLAKQLWRLLENSDSLLSRILKARYYPNSDVLGATLGSNPSYTWRCIFGAKYVLEAGLRWRVGNGARIYVWGDKWLPRETTFQPTSPRGNHPIDMKVCEFVIPELRQWDVDLLKNVFNEYDTKCILSIPLSNSSNMDKRIWHYNRNGLFSVRSAYHLAVKLARDELNAAESSSNAVSTGEWKWLWSMNLPSKIKNFAWRACRNFLPTRANLVKRKIMEDDSCIFCQSATETALHCLVSCCFSRQIWALSNISWTTYGCAEASVADWFRKMKMNSDSQTFELCMVVCWAIWHCRNKSFFDGTAPCAMEVAGFVQRYWFDLKKATATVLQSECRTSRRTIRWQAPGVNKVKLNFDASINSELGVCGLGVVARSNTGDCIGWTSTCIRQPLDPLTAEAKAALYAVEFARTHQWDSIILEGDSNVIITAIQVSLDSSADFGNVISDIKDLVAEFSHFKAQHIGREGNRVAHEIASLSRVVTFSLDVLPLSILNIVSSEAHS